VVDGLRARLIEQTGDTVFDLRARIEAGLALGALGDPRFERRDGPHGAYLMPPLVEVAGGRYPIGDDEPIAYASMGATGTATAHMPRHELFLEGFQIGRFPVTNAEYACFLAAGGYDNDRWWTSEDARAWRRGALPSAGQKSNIRTWRKRFQDQPTLLARMIEEERFASETVAARWQGWMALDDTGFEAALTDHVQGRLETEPRFWHDGRHNHPSQPVVGLCWYEARAYCAWLAAQTGLAVRLPTEVEWEAAARGTDARAYAHGEAFDRLAANTLETHVNRPTPVGVFPNGRTREGIDDLSGNVFEWTLSLYGDSAVDEHETEFPYPYNPTDGREDTDAAPSVRRVVRGGGWNNGHPIARTAFREFNHPDYANDNYGFRLAVGKR
jgi:formylglycine-generating enzyme required for sulfatase activity